MAINKVVNKSTKAHGAMRNVIEYVLKDQKIKDGYVDITGPYNSNTINYDDVYRNWLEEKRLWGKDSGRMYAHNIISFHKDENISPEEVLSIGRDFTDRFFPEHQCLIGVHQDKDHLHCHIVTNSVSFIDGRKLHQTKKDLDRQKEFTNNLCLEKGLSVAEKGKHFDGTSIEYGTVTAWSKDKYNLAVNLGKNSFIADCASAVLDVLESAENKEDFISMMKNKGWSVTWEAKKKHITFQDKNGNKVRDSNISKTFNLDIDKESLYGQFIRTHEQREEDRKLVSEFDDIFELARGSSNNTRTAIRNLEDATSDAKSREAASRDVAGERRLEEQLRLENERRMQEAAERKQRVEAQSRCFGDFSR